MKKPLTISIDKELILWIDRQIDGTGFRNRSHFVEKALLKFKAELEQQIIAERQTLLEKNTRTLKEGVLKEQLAHLESDLDSALLDALISLKAKREIRKKMPPK